MRASAAAALATVGTFDGAAVDLILPPGKEFASRILQDRRSDVVSVLQDMFGVSPTIKTTVREGAVVEAESDEPAPTPEAAEALLKAQFGAEVVEED